MYRVERRRLLLATTAIVLASAFQPAAAFNLGAVRAIQDQLNAFATEHENHGIQFSVGNAKTGEEQHFFAGCARKPDASTNTSVECTRVGEDTIFRMASMTKIMSGAMAAIAFEEGVVQPGDSISNWIPEFDAANLKAVTEKDGSYSVEPLSRNITLWDLLGMRGGFSYAFFAQGPFAEDTKNTPDRLMFEPYVKQMDVTPVCKGLGTASGRLMTPAEYLTCMRDVPLLSQPGVKSLYGYDYDVLGMVLGRAYKMTPEALMKEKIWSPLGMNSAMMSHAKVGDPRVERVIDLHFKGPGQTTGWVDFAPVAGLPEGEWTWASDVDDKTWDEVRKGGLSAHISKFGVDVTADGLFPGVSGYGEGSMMTMRDYSKFLRMIVNRGALPNGKRVLGPVAWKWLMSSTVTSDAGIGLLQSKHFLGDTDILSPECDWKFGYSRQRGNTSNFAGASSQGPMQAASEFAGSWGGYFGTYYEFDEKSGIYLAGGENTFWGSQSQDGKAFIEANRFAWLGMLTSNEPSTPVPPPPPPVGFATSASFSAAAIAQIQKEMDEFSEANEWHPLQISVGNAQSGVEHHFFSGCASKPAPGTGYSGCRRNSEKTLFRMASMTKVMGATVAAIAFAEGVVKPNDPISKWIPEFDYTKLTAMTELKDANGGASTWAAKPLLRDITLWDLLGMTGGFGYSWIKNGGLAKTARAEPDRTMYDKMLELEELDPLCRGGLGTAGGGKLIRPEDFIRCRAQAPLLSQPGARSIYGYDYDVLGMVLGRAYNMTPEALMREKLWDPIGMDSAMLFHAKAGDPRIADIADVHFIAPPAINKSDDNWATYTPPGELPPGKWAWASEVPDGVWQTMQESDLGVHASDFAVEETADGVYPGISGYGEGGVMTMRDYSKFLRMLTNNGYVGKKRVLSPVAWKWVMTSTVITDEGMRSYNQEADGYLPNWIDNDWKFGYQRRRNDVSSTDAGAPTTGPLEATSPFCGTWGGYFGTTYSFDEKTGLYYAGGENTLLIAEQTGSAFAASNRARFISLLTAPAGPAPAEGCAGAGCVTAPTGFNKAGMARVQAELDAWSAAHAGHPLAYTVGNAKTGDTASFVSGCASKPNADGTCKKADEDTIFRLASMTKIMGGTMAAIAFEEGKVKPGDSISNWIPEFDAANLKAVTITVGDDGEETYSVEPLARNITVWDLLGMRGGFGYGFWTQGDFAGSSMKQPDALTFDKVAKWPDICKSINTGNLDNRLVTQAEYISCRVTAPMLAQPGTKALYGYDYDVLGMVLGRAYEMTPEALMKKRLWDPLGMASAMMFHAQEGDPRLEKIVELHFQGPKLKTEDTYEPYTGTPELTPGEWKWASEISNATWADVSEQGLSTSMAPFTAEVTKDGVYPGVSGYGEGSMMTLADYGKFLSMIANHGMVGNTRILGPIAWKWLMTSTVTTSQGIGVLHSNYDASGSSGLFSVEMDWRFGYARPRGNVSSSDVSGAPIGGKPSVGPVLAASAFSGQWAGYYGTTYAFDEASGLYRVGGENTWLAGQPQLGNAFIADNNARFLGMITTPVHREANFAARPLPTAAPAVTRPPVQQPPNTATAAAADLPGCHGNDPAPATGCGDCAFAFIPALMMCSACTVKDGFGTMKRITGVQDVVGLEPAAEWCGEMSTTAKTDETTHTNTEAECAPVCKDRSFCYYTDQCKGAVSGLTASDTYAHHNLHYKPDSACPATLECAALNAYAGTTTPFSSNAMTTAPDAPARCHQIGGDDGRGGDLSKRFYGGPKVHEIHRKYSPDGNAWKWWECANECRKHGTCAYWYIPQKTRNCVMRSKKSSSLAAASFFGNSEGVAHGDKDPNCDGLDPDAPCRNQPGGCDKCTRIADDTGFFGGGASLAVFQRTSAPNGRVWAWYQCAAECTRNTACNYYFIHPTSKACVLRATKAGPINNNGNGGGHGMRSEHCTGYSRENDFCTQSSGASEGFHGGARLKTLVRKEAPARRGFAWYECAGECTRTAGCVYWYVTSAKVCVLRKAKAGVMSGVKNKARAHGDVSQCDGYCPSEGCDADHPRVMGKWHPHGHRATTATTTTATKTTSTPSSTSTFSCNELIHGYGAFMCHDRSKCIRSVYKCDGVGGPDCEDGSDESEETCGLTTDNGGY